MKPKTINAFITLKSLETVKTTDLIFGLIETEFDEWFDYYSENNRDIELVYKGSCEQEPLATKKGAILYAIELISYYMEEEDINYMTWEQIKKQVDFEGAFEI